MVYSRRRRRRSFVCVCVCRKTTHESEPDSHALVCRWWGNTHTHTHTLWTDTCGQIEPRDEPSPLYKYLFRKRFTPFRNTTRARCENCHKNKVGKKNGVGRKTFYFFPQSNIGGFDWNSFIYLFIFYVTHIVCPTLWSRPSCRRRSELRIWPQNSGTSSSRWSSTTPAWSRPTRTGRWRTIGTRFPAGYPWPCTGTARPNSPPGLCPDCRWSLSPANMNTTIVIIELSEVTDSKNN